MGKNYDFEKIEEEILKFWKENNIYGKSREKNKGNDTFYLMDGPPYATGKIHIGTAMNKILKDIAMRSRRIQGYDVFDRAGYDTHGLPIEYKVEKEIGSKTKEDIENFGVRKFIEKCKEFATKHIDDMNKEFKNLGVWMDFDNPYLTLAPEYIETIWDVFKSAEEKGLLYLGKYPVHVCPRCETAVAYNEIEYGNVKDTSVYVKFPLENRKNTYLIVWTTTPWTFPGNTGVMVHPDYKYQEIEMSDGEKWIIAKEIVPELMQEMEAGYTPKKEYEGKEMEGWKYENPLAKDLNLDLDKNRSYKVVLSGRHVNLEEGTGLVHTAPGHGKEDFQIGQENNLEMPSPVDINGKLTNKAGKYEGKKARIVDDEIISDLEENGYLAYKKEYPHDYPFCWRCNSPLLMLSRPQWFFKISDIRDDLLEENEKNNWVPEWMGSRMKAWLEDLGDWPVSRKRYWGTPLPLWVCDKCDKRKVVGTIEELEKESGEKVEEIHKPEIDKIKIDCECGGKMERVEDVLDVWFDPGVASWAALGYPKEKENLEKYWPADLNIEGKDQVRGWWNSQMILSQIKFGKKPFKSILEHGMILDLGKKKMSKSEGNVVTPDDMIRKFGRDKMRYYFAKISKGEDFSYNKEEFREIENVFRVLLNINRYIKSLDVSEKNIKDINDEQIEDKWILSRFNSILKDVTKNYNNYYFPKVVQALENFLIQDVSKKYIQITRDRRDETYEILNNIRNKLLKLFAPIIPFISEEVWQKLREEEIVDEESVHLSKWPKIDKNKIDEKLEKKMVKVFEIIEKGSAERDREQIGKKWPLPKAKISCYEEISEKNLGNALIKIIKKQLNVEEIKFESSEGPSQEETEEKINVELDTKMTPELKAIGYLNVIGRKVQSARKKAGLNREDKIDLQLNLDEDLKKMLENKEKYLKERVNADKIFIDNNKERFKNKDGFNIRKKKVCVSFEKRKV